MKRILYLLLVLAIIFQIPVTASAALKGDCSVEVTLKYKDTKITGGTLKAVRVGYVDFDTATFRKMTDDTEIQNIGEESAVKEMLKYHGDNKNKYTFDYYTADVKDGKALFDDIPMGLYLIYQEKAATGYNNIAPFLVTVPYGDETDVSIASKPELEIEPNKPGESNKKPTYGNKLPQTGQLTWPIPWLAASGMLLFAIGWWLCFGRRKDSYES